ncbi:Exonuclease V - a 5' deoxyribonuclease-like protein [Elsinoe fawcettii]|nr:Exonuclease V - a 5' deoxyribonuclease-like protein [Elsinoe fawcettii]
MPATTRAAASHLATVVSHDESDYGSDIDDDTISDLLVRAESQPLHAIAVESIEEHNPLPQVVRVPNTDYNSPRARRTKTYIDEDGITFEVPDNDGPLREPSVEVEYDERNRVAFSPEGDARQRRLFASFQEESQDDSRSPLERFRAQPKKPMSVTDLVSPSWCELQYLYSLSKYGRVKQTPAMKQGSTVHKELEEEVHIAVSVETVTREDMFALRIWNIIQGLRTLRATGMTRELEVWGVIEGQVVNGVIDELSYKCPDSTLEAALTEKKKRGRPKKSEPELAPNQSTLSSFLSTSTNAQPLSQALASSSSATAGKKDRRVYITDIKTRTSPSLPSDETSLRPTFLQLMLYRRLLTQLSMSEVPSSQIFERYRVSPTATFSDTFIAQIGGLDYNFPSSASEDPDYAPPMSSPQDSVDELLSHNTLSTLWDLMIDEFGLALHCATLPARTPGALSPLIQAEFRASGLASRRGGGIRAGQVLGRKVFVHDERRLENYVKDEMSWWKGERPTKGVEIEEAFKCRICVFAEGCEWRVKKVEDQRVKRELRRKSGGEGMGRSEV